MFNLTIKFKLSNTVELLHTLLHLKLFFNFLSFLHLFYPVTLPGSSQPSCATRKCTCWPWIYLGAIDTLRVKRDEATIGQQQDQLGEDVVSFVLYAVAEAVDGHVIRTFLCRQPYIMYVALWLLLYLAA